MLRTFTDPEGHEWSARIVSHGKTSAYLSPKVNRPIVQFTPKGKSSPARYAALPVSANGLGDMDDDALRRLWGRSKSH
ncbi:MAG TPA: hypothetical protein VGI83_03655 [Gemmatimonadales bacterium]|jgi:hypothetical protein